METCENCGRAIGKLEEPCVWNDRVVCPECNDRLESQRPSSQKLAAIEAGVDRTAAELAIQRLTHDLNVMVNAREALAEREAQRITGTSATLAIVTMIGAGVISGMFIGAPGVGVGLVCGIIVSLAHDIIMKSRPFYTDYDKTINRIERELARYRRIING